MWIFVILTLVAVVGARPDDYYDEKYDNFNVKEIVDNIRLLKSYSLCIRGKGKCTPEGKDFKKWAPDAVRSQCAKCTEKQKPLVATVIKAIIEKLPEDWEDLSKEYSPKGDATYKLNQFIQQYAPNE